MYQKAVVLWHALSVAERQEWESLARPKHMTGFAWFISQALKPNPGLYLPLQGGTMAGDIDMDGHRIEDLPDPTADQDAATKKYHDDNLPAAPYTQGCKLWRTAAQSIPDGSITNVIFDQEIYDTDGMHSTITNPERITIKTAGIYIVTLYGYFDSNPVGCRRAYIYRNGFIVHQYRKSADLAQRTFANIVTIVNCPLNVYLTARVYQDSGAPLDLMRSSTYSPIFATQKIG
ncbi:hypothetical protein ES705_39503 [subsurface metagenome]